MLLTVQALFSTVIQMFAQVLQLTEFILLHLAD